MLSFASGNIRNREELDELDEDEIDDAKKFPPIITKYREIQDLAKFINNENALAVMEKYGKTAGGIKGEISNMKFFNKLYEQMETTAFEVNHHLDRTN